MKRILLALILVLVIALPTAAQDVTEEATGEATLEVTSEATTEATAETTAEASENPFVIEDTVAYWSFDSDAAEGDPLAEEETVVTDLSGNGNDLSRVDMENGEADNLVWSDDAADNMPSEGSIRIFGNNETQIGAYLITAENAPLNATTFEDGYTVEAFIKLPEDWSGETNAWTGILSRQGTGADAGKTGSDPAEPVGHLAVSNFPEFQWAVWPLDNDETQTNWSDQLALGEWYHVAIINDADTTIMYVNGEEVLRNPDPGQVGITSLDLPWTVGGTHYDNEPNTFNGWIGDIRIVARPLGFDEFLTAELE